MNSRERIRRKLDREREQIRTEYWRIWKRLRKLASPGERHSFLRISDDFTAIERAAQRARWRAYELYLWLGREEIKRQQKTARGQGSKYSERNAGAKSNADNRQRNRTAT